MIVWVPEIALEWGTPTREGGWHVLTCQDRRDWALFIRWRGLAEHHGVPYVMRLIAWPRHRRRWNARHRRR